MIPLRVTNAVRILLILLTHPIALGDPPNPVDAARGSLTESGEAGVQHRYALLLKGEPGRRFLHIPVEITSQHERLGPLLALLEPFHYLLLVFLGVVHATVSASDGDTAA